MACQWTTHGDPESGSRTRRRSGLDWMLTSPIGRDEQDEHNNHGMAYDRDYTPTPYWGAFVRAALRGVSFAD